MRTALDHDGPIIFMEHKLLADNWLDALGRGGRSTIAFDVPAAGALAERPLQGSRVPLGTAAVLRAGADLTLVSLGVGVHRALEAAEELERQAVSAGVIDLRSVSPLDVESLCEQVVRTGRVVVIDEDYLGFGLSGEIAARLLEAGVRPRFARVATDGTIPYARHLEIESLPNTTRILDTCRQLLED
jgi:pyruvate dehydrogenase E1 component beta subunit